MIRRVILPPEASVSWDDKRITNTTSEDLEVEVPADRSVYVETLSAASRTIIWMEES